jgi:small-conductance mechanosensitive channel
MQALTPEQRRQIDKTRQTNRELFEAMLTEDTKKKLAEKQRKANEKQAERKY